MINYNFFNIRNSNYLRRFRLLKYATIDRISCNINEITSLINRTKVNLSCFRNPIELVHSKINATKFLINHKSYLGE